MEAAATIVARDANGVPSADGLVGWVSIGMSNTVQETKVFERDADRNARRNGRLVPFVITTLPVTLRASRSAIA